MNMLPAENQKPRTKNESIKTIKSAIALKITILPTGVFLKQLKQFYFLGYLNQLNQLFGLSSRRPPCRRVISFAESF